MMEFLKAYIWMYGVGRRKAQAVWKEVRHDKNYVDAIVKAWKDNAKDSFYND